MNQGKDKIINELADLRQRFAELKETYAARTAEFESAIKLLRSEIMERMQTEEKLREKEKQYRNIIDTTIEGVWIIDSQANTIFANRQMAELLGYTIEEINGRNLFEFMDEAAKKEAERYLERRRKGVRERHDFRFKRKDGSDIWTLVSSNPIIDDEGKFSGALAMVADITDRKKVEEALLLEKKRLEEVTSNANCGLFLLDDRAKIMYANSVAEKWFGPLVRIKGEYCWKVFNIKEPKNKCAALIALRTGDISHSETFMNKVSGEERFFYEIATPVKDKDERICQINAVVMDITERKRAEEQIKRSLEEKDVLMKEIHHRVKNNMTIVSSLLTLQSNKVEDEHYRAMFSESINRIKTMALIHEKLYQSEDLAKIVFSAYIRDMVNDICMTYSLSPRIKLIKDIGRVTLGVDASIPCGLIVNELITNAIKYAFPEGRTGEVKVSLNSNDKDEIELAVCDDGVGMPEGLDFRNADSLGLTLVNALVKQLQGKIELNKEKGTKFKITFRKR